jgi:hypothetical protein
LWLERGNADEAVAVLTRAAEAGDWEARGYLAKLLRERINATSTPFGAAWNEGRDEFIPSIDL